VNIELKEASEDFYEFAFAVKREAMGPHITAKWGWDEELQLSIHEQRWKEKPWFIICLEGVSIGTVSIDHLADAVRIGEFYILDEYRNKGVGTKVLLGFLAQCDKESKRVVLEYLKWNPVGSLYKRYGFRLTHENEIHYFMAREPRFH